jgi:hypothetical protein
MYLNQNYNYIIEHLSKKKRNIEDLFSVWLNHKNNYYNLMNISPRELNERYKMLSKPFNSYCKANYIDNNFIVDQILQMSLPYSESRNPEEQKVKTEISMPSTMNVKYDFNVSLYFNMKNIMMPHQQQITLPPKLRENKPMGIEQPNFLYLEPGTGKSSNNLASFVQRYPSQEDLYNHRGDSYTFLNEPNFIFSRQQTFNPINYEEPPVELNKLHVNQTSFKNLLRSNSSNK